MLIYIYRYVCVIQLYRAPDGFSVVAEYFGRGVFNKVSLGMRTVEKVQLGPALGFKLIIPLFTRDRLSGNTTD